MSCSKPTPKRRPQGGGPEGELVPPACEGVRRGNWFPLQLMSDRILIVEDDDGIRETLKYHLDAAGYLVTEARDGAIGLRLARTSRPDLVLLDLMLPGMSGMGFCRALRRSSRVPIIMVTAKDSEVDKIVGLELGADDYVTKPFSVREVLARVN